MGWRGRGVEGTWGGGETEAGAIQTGAKGRCDHRTPAEAGRCSPRASRGVQSRRRLGGGLHLAELRKLTSKLQVLRFVQLLWQPWACSVTQSHPALCDPLGCSPPGSSVHETFQARVLEWVAISSSRGSSPPRDWLLRLQPWQAGSLPWCHLGGPKGPS